MRSHLLSAALAAIPLCSGCGAYVGLGRSWLPYQGHALHPTVETHLGYSSSRFPNWAAAWALTTAQGAHDSAAFVEPRCYTGTIAEQQAGKGAGCHPRIFANSNALDVQYRWRVTRSLRPVASLGLGRLRTGYLYRVVGGPRRSDSVQTSPVVTVRGGGELSLTAWAHVTFLAGYRESFRNTSLNGTVSNSGFAVTSLLVLGKR